ncbi:hypothetical protein MLD38_031437 [Melastoma candidum]|uniref:Uncharacterized protein n=1 Tax=Melastoma candidum TaxID=119954 RepID=A0ACB9MRK4_9MYRT|nr:hypothetical protein MLD38_031437 [Melastoma candidum]
MAAASSSASASLSGPRDGSSRTFVFVEWDVPIPILELLEHALYLEGIHADGDIGSSRVAVSFFSKYSLSSFCFFDELVDIMDRRRRGELIVLPVFCGVDPGDMGRFGEAFLAEEINRNRSNPFRVKVIERWKKALREVGCLSGWHLDGRVKMEDLVKIIVKEVAFKLCNWRSGLAEARWGYDVFLSFRGPDCRNTIIGHLYRALCQKGIRTFKDNEELEVGQTRSEVFEAIKGSRIAIILLSQNYAHSKWCLDELTKIMECKVLNKLIVLPIFYRVSPGDVRLGKKENGEKGSYQSAMEEMEARYRKDSEMVEGWKEALWEAGDSMGFCLPEGADEGDVVVQVTKKVAKILNHVLLEVAEYPVGISSRLQDVKRLLDTDPSADTIHVLGILGPGGVGKTTLSKAICNDIARDFDSWCFLSKVRETALVDLQRTLLRELLYENDLMVSSVDMGKVMIQHRLCNKRVLVILDDVDEFDQINALAGNVDWFGKGSRIIITTRNRHLLNSYEVRFIYEARLFDDDEAEDFFRYNVTNGRRRSLDIERSLINRFLLYAKGLPLALQVLGRSLCGRSMPEWENMLRKLDHDPPESIISVLKVSFDGLDYAQQEVFLDIACFFKGWDRDYVVKVLNGCGFHMMIDVNILSERCLITIEDGKFQMHDLLEAMGKIIAYGKCSGEVGIQSRTWLYDEFADMLSENMVRILWSHVAFIGMSSLVMI